MEENLLFLEEQKSCCKLSCGYVCLLTINISTTEEKLINKAGLNMARIDFQSTFDSIPQAWIPETRKLK